METRFQKSRLAVLVEDSIKSTIGLYKLIELNCKNLSDEAEIVFNDYGAIRGLLRVIYLCMYRIYWFGIFKVFRNIGIAVKKKFNLEYDFNFNKVEIEITTECNLKCPHCNRSCGQAKSNEFIPVEKIQKFIRESIAMNKKWQEIRLIGGEPTLHKDISQIFEIMLDYKKNYSPYTRISLVTNGVGIRVSEILQNIPKGIFVENSMKSTGIKKFESYNVAPIDLEEYKNKKTNFFRGCYIIEKCGIGLTRYGYYPCGAGASVDRVFNFDIGIKELTEATKPEMRKQLRRLCMLCGHFKTREPQDTSINSISSSWEDAYSKYNRQKPELSLY